MKVIKGDKTVYFDVDDTLVHWRPVEGARTLKIRYGAFKEVFEVTVIEENVEAIKLHASRNHTIVVWSAGGAEWAEAVVKALGLKKCVDLVVCKPTWVYDDLDPVNFMPKRMWGVKDPNKQ